MNESQPDYRKAEKSRAGGSWMQPAILAAICALVIGVYACTAHSGFLLSSNLNAASDYYNLLVQGFRAGHLSLNQEVPSGLSQLADPYDPAAHSHYAVLDVSYYRGKLYLYFGVTPAVLLFWPYMALTGHYLPQKDAGVIFCLVGFLASLGLLCALWRRYFFRVNVGVMAVGALALGLVTWTPSLLARCDAWEIPISCGYALTMLALAAIWKALHEPEPRRSRGWLAAASLAFGLAVGARPSLLFGMVILLVPVAQAWRERRRLLAPLLGVAGPIVLIGLGLMIYNGLRFDNPFEFGWRYQLSGIRQDTGYPFHPRNLWFNFRIYFLEPARWSSRFPFVHDIKVPAPPVGHVGGLEHPFGVLTNIPLVWLALAVPLGWRWRPAHERAALCGFLAAVTTLFGVAALTISLLVFGQGRYEMEFLPALVLLAVIGILSAERALVLTPESRRIDHPVRRRSVRLGWGLLLVFSVVFNLLASIRPSAEAHYNEGLILDQQGKSPEAIGQYQRALRLDPDSANPHNNLAAAMINQGRLQEARAHCEQALRIQPDHAEAHNNLATVLVQSGNVPQAIEHWQQALRINPEYADAHCNLALALEQLGRTQQAIQHYEQALRLKPDLVKAHYNLASALLQRGELPEAIRHYELALQLRPDYAEAHNNLGLALVGLGRLQEAVEHWEQALRINPNFALAHYNLGSALEQVGRIKEAIGQYEQALRIQPDFVQAQNALARARAAQ
jgi:tetratricopeptide (TPR) repeat protein